MPELPRHIKITKEILHELEILLSAEAGTLENNFTIVDSLSAHTKTIFSDMELAAYEEGYDDGKDDRTDECNCSCDVCEGCKY